MPETQSTAKNSSIWRKLSPKCGNRSCEKKTWLKAFGQRNPGLNLEGDWYCCPECFGRAVREKIADLMNSQGTPAKARTSRVPLGLLLLQRGVLSEEQLKTALNLHRETQSNFGEIVQQLGFATPEQVTAAVAAQWACPVFSVGERRPDVQGVRIPRRFIELYGMLPVHYSESERRLLIGFVSSVQHQILYTIGHMTACTPVPCFITAREYELHSPSGRTVRDDEIVLERIVDTAELGRITTSHVVKLGANRIRMGTCRDYLWIRLWGKREMDLLFRVRSS
jgi:hypothetical protein